MNASIAMTTITAVSPQKARSITPFAEAAMTLLRRLIHRQRSRHTYFFNQIEDLGKNGKSDEKTDYNDGVTPYVPRHARQVVISDDTSRCVYLSTHVRHTRWFTPWNNTLQQLRNKKEVYGRTNDVRRFTVGGIPPGKPRCITSRRDF